MALHLYNLSLRDRPVTELRALAVKYDVLAPADAELSDKSDLVAALSTAATTNARLVRELKTDQVTIKPSFYLLSIRDVSGPLLSLRSARDTLNANLATATIGSSSGQGSPMAQAFASYEHAHPSADRVEVQLTWERALWYWSPDVTYARVYELQVGFVVLDFKHRKAIIACHSESERDAIGKAIGKTYGCKLTALTLTKKVLDQIGTFDKVKRATYHVHSHDPTVPESISFADEELATIPMVRREEENDRSVREQSFYRIPIGESEVAYGVGATSRSGKLWLPRETPLKSVREFGVGLLAKVTKTIDTLGRGVDVDEVARILSLEQLPEVGAIQPLDLREKVVDLIKTIAKMLARRQSQSAFPTPRQFARDAVPSWFNPPALLLVDENTGVTTAWSDNAGRRLVEIDEDNGREIVRVYPRGPELDLNALVHPLTDEEMVVVAPLSSLLLIPTAALLNVVQAGIRLLATEVSKLDAVLSVPFRLSQDSLIVDIKAAFGTSSKDLLDTVIDPSTVAELRSVMKGTLPASDDSNRVLRSLGEKCAHMSDSNCRTCVSAHEFLCLRSLVATFFRKALLLQHKGIELSDGQFTGALGGLDERMFMFAKVASTGGLTARNGNGAVLLSQVIGQVDKAAFSVAVVVSPSTINEDLRDRLALICGIFGKKLLILDHPALARLWREFRDRLGPDEGIDVQTILSNSKRTRRAPRPTASAKNAKGH